MQAMPLGLEPRDSLAAIFLGLLSAAAFPPLGLWPLAPLAVVLFLVLIRDRPPRIGFNLGLVYGATYGLATMYWFYGLFGMLASGLIALFGCYFGLLSLLTSLTRDYPPLLRAALVALFAVGIEWLRGDAWYLRFPWYTVPHALAAEPWTIAPVRWVGTYGLSYLVWLIAAAGAFHRCWNWSAFLVLPALALLLPAAEEPDRRALLLQTEREFGVESLIPTVSAENVDLAVLPEYAYFAAYQQALRAKQGPVTLARKLTCPVIFGAEDRSLPGVDPDNANGLFENVAVVLDAQGQVVGTFPKQHPVPLMRDGQPGKRRPVFPVAQGTLGVAVCYDFDAPEIAGSLVEQGATLLVAPTYDAMSWGWSEHVHHELLLRLRAVETDRWIVRAVSSGRSEAISPRGVPSVEGVEIGEVGTVVVRYAHRDTQTWGARAYVLGPAAALGTLLFLAVHGLRSWRKRRGKTDDPSRAA